MKRRCTFSLVLCSPPQLELWQGIQSPSRAEVCHTLQCIQDLELAKHMQEKLVREDMARAQVPPVTNIEKGNCVRSKAYRLRSKDVELGRRNKTCGHCQTVSVRRTVLYVGCMRVEILPITKLQRPVYGGVQDFQIFATLRGHLMLPTGSRDQRRVDL